MVAYIILRGPGTATDAPTHPKLVPQALVTAIQHLVDIVRANYVVRTRFRTTTPPAGGGGHTQLLKRKGLFGATCLASRPLTSADLGPASILQYYCIRVIGQRVW